ncbi:MAG TPA: acetyl-CoA carboxylase carboxyltransferase subunit alpha [Candidatus Acidoferrales bacterium]|nr:acetyl-CoA carboxylase carboxyltransferase subunit alpha [Candidatus Acidoferrales bacterium]
MAKGDRRRRKGVARLEREMDDLAHLAPPDPAAEQEIERIRREISELRGDILEHPSAWQRTMLARHPQRPYTLDYVRFLFEGFSEIHGDRGFGDDAAIVCGMARFHGRPVMVVGHQKGRDTRENVARNWGMPKPEGYRKALRAMRLAAKFARPVVTFVDTMGAYPGVDAEERGQAEAIARNLREMARLPVPIVVNVTGEGGSGGALAIAVGDRVHMLENAVYSVISPEGCASILWRDKDQAPRAAAAMKITAPDLSQLGIIDEIVPEPSGGAHTNPEQTARALEPVLERALDELARMPAAELLERRYRKFRRMGLFFAG